MYCSGVRPTAARLSDVCHFSYLSVILLTVGGWSGLYVLDYLCGADQGYLILTTQVWQQTSGDPSGLTWNYRVA